MHIVYGGAFNSPTVAHLQVYLFVEEKLPVKRITFLPVSSAYTKSELISNGHRLAMLKLMTQRYDDVDICDIEMRDDTFRGTYQTLIRLSDTSNEPLAFVIGADNVVALSSWKMAKSLLSEFKIIILNRHHIDIDVLIDKDPLLREFKDQFIIFNDFNFEGSSTEFRHTYDATLVDDKVFDYIKTHDLYKE